MLNDIHAPFFDQNFIVVGHWPWRFTTRVRLRIMNRPAGFPATAAAKAARASSSERQIASVS
jgi:hypothetical protein